MKNIFSTFLILLSFGSAFLFTSCGDGEKSNQQASNGGGCPAGSTLYNNQCYPSQQQGYQYGNPQNNTSCQSGFVYVTNAGCLPQTGCAAGYANWNGQCIQQSGPPAQGSCTPNFIYSTSNGRCLPIANCGSGYGFYNDRCVQL